MIVDSLSEVVKLIKFNSIKIKLGSKLFLEAKATLGSIATKLKGVDFELDATIDRNEVIIS